MVHELTYTFDGPTYEIDLLLSARSLENIRTGIADSFHNSTKHEQHSEIMDLVGILDQIDDQIPPYHERNDKEMSVSLDMTGEQYTAFSDALARQLKLLVSTGEFQAADELFQLWLTVTQQVDEQAREEFDMSVTDYEVRYDAMGELNDEDDEAESLGDLFS